MQSSFFSIGRIVVGVAAVAVMSATIAQEVQGQKGAAAAGVPKAVNVTQAQLNGAGGQTAIRTNLATARRVAAPPETRPQKHPGSGTPGAPPL